MVLEGILADGDASHLLRCVGHLGLSTQVVDLDHVSVLRLQERYQVTSLISVEGLDTGGWKARSYDVFRDIGHIQVDVSVLLKVFLPANAPSDKVAVAEGRGARLGLFYFGFLLSVFHNLHVDYFVSGIDGFLLQHAFFYKNFEGRLASFGMSWLND
jgi:hypothetical protein